MWARLCGLMIAAVLGSLPGAATLGAQGFEGVIQQRTIFLDGDALYEILYTFDEEELADEEDEFDEEQYLRAEVDRILGLPVDELLSMVSQSGLEMEIEEITMHVKGAKVRTDMGAFGYVIMDADEETLWMVRPENRIFVKWTQADVEAAERQTQETLARLGIDMEDIEGAGSEASDAATFEPLSRTAEINGFEATGYRAESRDDVTVGWLAEDVHGVGATFRALAERTEALYGDDEDASGSTQDLFWERGLPVRIQSVSTALGSLSHYEVTDFLSVEATSVADELFEIPEGFTEVSMEDLWR